eukprot:5227946-Amphidinium_carterae.1
MRGCLGANGFGGSCWGQSVRSEIRMAFSYSPMFFAHFPKYHAPHIHKGALTTSAASAAKKAHQERKTCENPRPKIQKVLKWCQKYIS